MIQDCLMRGQNVCFRKRLHKKKGYKIQKILKLQELILAKSPLKEEGELAWCSLF